MLTEHTNKAESLSVNTMLHLKCENGIRLLSAACLLGLSGLCFAETNSSSSEIAYVDSAYEWGSWELGIQPAAAAPAPSPQRAAAPRISGVQFRPNDNTAYAPNARAITQTTIMPAPLPAPVVIPVVPSSAPILPSQPLPSGGPGDRFF